MASLVQTAVGNGAAGVCSATLTATAGNTLILKVGNSSGSTNAFSVSDTVNTWTRDANGFLSGGAQTRIEIWSAPNVAAGSTTVTCTSLGTSCCCVLEEWSGILTSAILDVAAGGGNATSTTAGSVAQSTTNANDVLQVAVNYNTVSYANTPTHSNTGGIWTFATENHQSSMIVLSAWSDVASTGSYSDAWTYATTQVSGWVFASYKEVSATNVPGITEARSGLV